MRRTLGSYLAELLKYGGLCLVGLALAGVLVGAAQVALDLGNPLNGWVVAILLRPILGMLAIGGLCYAVGHMLLRDAKGSP